MTNSKAFNIMTLCSLKGIDPELDEAICMNTMSVLDLLNSIKTEREIKKDNSKRAESHSDSEEDCDISLSRRAGCQY